MKKYVLKEGNKKYLIDNNTDQKIYDNVKKLEKKKLNKKDKKLVKLIKTQLEKNWRKYLVQEINKLNKTYR
jgi:hypothetical protein